MRSHYLKSIIKKFIEAGYLPSDTANENLRKSSLLVMSVPFAFAGLGWGILYFVNGLYIPGVIPFSYGVLSIISVIYFITTKKFKFFRNSQLFLILILPFALQLSLGGFIPGSAVIMWAIISPVGALVFFSTRHSLIWFVSYIFLVIIAFYINDILPDYFDWNLDENFINFLFVLNIIGVSTIVYLTQYYFVVEQSNLKKAIELKNSKLKEQSEKLKEMNKIKSNFFANISHEFRTPLTLIIGLINKQISQPKTLLNPLDYDIINRNANRLLQLINQLLDLSKLESGKVVLKISKHDIVLYTKKMLLLFGTLAVEKNINVTLNGEALTEKSSISKIDLYFDKEKIQKILTNLLSNAFKFTPENGKINVIVEAEQNGYDAISKFIKISISNTGEGISQDNLPYVFDRFYQVESDSSGKYAGTGVGLALVKELVELHHGNVSVESFDGNTIFTVTLPFNGDYHVENEVIEQSTEVANDELPSKDQIGILEVGQSTEQVSDKNELENENSERLEILIVEDYQDLRNFIKESLHDEYKVIEAEDGEEGYRKAEEAIPDLIISDVMMPKMDGYELCEKLKTNKNTNHIPIILLTAKASRENKLEGLEIGADDYLIKPFDGKELGIRIKNLITIREQLQNKYQQEIWLKPKEVKVSSVHQKFLEDLKEIIEDNIDDDTFSVEILGHKIGMSRSQLHRKLKALTDQPPTTFIRNYRLRRAADLLQQEAGNVTEIAYQVGFSSQTYFTTCFQELFKCSPSEYKSQLSSEDQIPKPDK